MAEPELSSGCEGHLIDQFSVEELRQRAAVGEFGQQLLIESHTDHRCGIERLFSRSIETVDSGSDRGLKGRRHSDVRVVTGAHIFTSCPLEHIAVGKVTDDGLGEERIARRSVGDLRNQPRNG